MLEVKTIFNKIHRPARPTADGFIGIPGQWCYIDSSGLLTNIATTSTTQTQPKVLKMVVGVANSETYESHDTRSARRVATLEGVFRASVDDSGFQKYDTQGTPVAITYTQGMLLTPAYRTTTVGTSAPHYSPQTDIGKLRPAGDGDLVVARVENFDGTTLVFSTITIKPYEGNDDVWSVEGSGSLTDTLPVLYGDARMITPTASGDMVATIPELEGVGAQA